MEWVFLIIKQIFGLKNPEFKAFDFIKQLLLEKAFINEDNKENPLFFNEKLHKFLEFFYEIASKLIENQEQPCLLLETHEELLLNPLKTEFLCPIKENSPFALFYIQIKDFLTLIEWFNGLNKGFLAKFNEKTPIIPLKALLQKEIEFLHILLKVK